MTFPAKVGEVRTLDGIATQKIAEAINWDNGDYLVILLKVDEWGSTSWKVYDTDIEGEGFINTQSYTDHEKALQSWMNRAFGVNIF